jgi:hypothetical protein
MTGEAAIVANRYLVHLSHSLFVETALGYDHIQGGSFTSGPPQWAESKIHSPSIEPFVTPIGNRMVQMTIADDGAGA